MKKLASILTAAVLLFSTSSFAANGTEEKTSTKTNARVVASLKKDFSIAQEDVKWEKENGFYFASFKKGGNKTEAAYTEEGELVGVSKKISLAQLPAAVSASIAKKFDGYSIGNNAEEITYNNETNYMVTIANDKSVLKLKCSATGDITLEKKTKI